MKSRDNMATFESILKKSKDPLSTGLKTERLIPRRVTIETFFGCNASCIMCAINAKTDRKKGIMKQELFEKILEDLVPFKDQIEMMDLFGLGEPLLDKKIAERISLAKKKGFQNVAFSTNAELLTEERRHKIINSGVDTIIFSLDGISKKTHEGIRVGLDYDIVLNNILKTIELRDRENLKTRFVVRFISQDANRHEWNDYLDFWRNNLSFAKGDIIAKYDMHTFGGRLDKDSVLRGMEREKEISIEKEACPLPFDILYVLANGVVPLCHEDWLEGKLNLGNLNEENAIDVFNSRKLNKIREIHLRGKRHGMKPCNVCTVSYSATTRTLITA